MLLPLLALVPLAGSPAVVATEAEDPPVRVWINNDRRFRLGDRVKVQVETAQSGHLFIMQLDTDGALRVLFPLHPADDTRVEAGRRYEVRDPRSGESFRAHDDGVGLIYSALSADPYRFDVLVGPDGDWNADAIRLPENTEDPEADITAMVQQLVSPQGFDYDLLDYLVIAPRETVVNVPPPPSWWSPLWDDYYDYYYDCFGCYRHSGVYVHLGFGSWYWPTYWYRPWYYGYAGFHDYYPGYWGYPYGGFGRWRPVIVRPRRDVPVIMGRPRGYQVGHLGGRQVPQDGRARGDRRDGVRAGGDRGVPARRVDGRDDRPRARPVQGGRSEGTGIQRQDGRRSGGGATAGRSTAGTGSSGGSASRPRPRPRPDGDRSAATARRVSSAPPPSVERSRPESRRDGWVRVPGSDARQSGSRVSAPARRARPASADRSIRNQDLRLSTRASRGTSVRESFRVNSGSRSASTSRTARPSSRTTIRSSSRPAIRSAPRPSVRSSSRPSVRSSSRGSVSRSPAVRSGSSRARSSGGSSRARRKN